MLCTKLSSLESEAPTLAMCMNIDSQPLTVESSIGTRISLAITAPPKISLAGVAKNVHDSGIGPFHRNAAK